jgi:hypothetical protein
MSPRPLYYFLLYGVDVLSVLLAVIALRWPALRRSSWLWCAAALLALTFIARTGYFFLTWDSKSWCYDFSIMWWSGAHAWRGEDPYIVQGLDLLSWGQAPASQGGALQTISGPSSKELCQFYYPPFTLVFFKLLALIPLERAKILWTALFLSLFPS